MLRVGVDIGGTNTDAAVLRGHEVLGTAKVPTTEDVLQGFSEALAVALRSASIRPNQVEAVMVGTTQFINAIVTRTHLAKVALLRLCGSATVDLPPFIDFPAELKSIIGVYSAMLPGGFLYDGTTMEEIDANATRIAARAALAKGAQAVVISGVFSPMLAKQEHEAADIVKQELAAAGLSDVSITISSDVAGLGLLERENAAVLNATLRPLAGRVLPATHAAVVACGCSNASLYMTQNDGTVIAAAEAERLPIRCVSCGPVNSLRGASLLSGIKDAMVVDVGGTTTDVGAIIGGFPRPSSFDAYIGNVRTNSPVPLVHSIGIGGGSLVSSDDSHVGPSSVGSSLLQSAISFGGNVCTATDVAFLLGHAPSSLLAKGSVDSVRNVLARSKAEAAWADVQEQIAAAVDSCKVTSASVQVILVGGGAFLVHDTIPSVHAVVRPPHADSANAVGAAAAQVSGSVESVVQLTTEGENKLIDDMRKTAIDRAVAAGALLDSCQVVEIEKVPLAYLPGNTCRVKVRAVGDLKFVSSHTMPPAAILSQNQSEPTPNSAHRITAANATSSLDAGSLCKSTSSKTKAAGSVSEGGPAKRHCIGLEANPTPQNGEWLLRESDVDALELGVGVLGTGGGGAPRRAKLALLQAMRRGGQPRVVPPDGIADTSLILEGGYMGAPTVGIEMLMAGEATAAVKAVLAAVDGDAAAVISGEIGGSNGLVQLLIAVQLGLPVVDGDFMGTAFPRLDQGTNTIYGLPLTPVGLADHLGNTLVVQDVASPSWLERLLRPVSTAMGCRAGLAFKPLTGAQMKQVCIRHTVSQAYRLGTAILEARQSHKDPVFAVASAGSGKVLFVGKLHDVSRQTSEGFAVGSFTIKGYQPQERVRKPQASVDISANRQTMVIDFQNEFLVARMPDDESSASAVVASVPDLICILETSTGRPIQTEELRYGLWISVVILPAHPMHRTPQGLLSVGPRAFGYDFDWSPTLTYVEPTPMTDTH